jgi:hypothetical protein
MKTLVVLFFLLLIAISSFFVMKTINREKISGAPPYMTVENTPSNNEVGNILQDWTRPDEPVRVGLQVGHWKNDEVPEELKRLKGNTGSSGGGKSEWEVNYEIAMQTKALLEKQGITVDILPATVPEKYWADVFISIHADGSTDRNTSGYKAATPRRDLTENADELLTSVENAYQEATGLKKDPNISRNMKGYYAFGWWRYDHAVHPMTTSLILETGFLTNSSDRKILIDNPQLSAQGLADGIITYLSNQKLI